jgi:hypothetical protein
VLLFGAACSAGGGDDAAGAGAPSAAALPGAAASGPGQSSGDATLAGNTDAICDQAARTAGQFAATFAQDLKLLIEAQSAQDKAQAARVKQKTSRDVDNYSYALADMSKLAADPTLKQALGEMSKQVAVLKGDVRNLDQAKLAALQATLDSACRK